MEQVQFRVIGMDCAEEVTALRAALNPMKGIHELSFDILSGKMTVAFDPSLATPENIAASRYVQNGPQVGGLDGSPLVASRPHCLGAVGPYCDDRGQRLVFGYRFPLAHWLAGICECIPRRRRGGIANRRQAALRSHRSSPEHGLLSRKDFKLFGDFAPMSIC